MAERGRYQDYRDAEHGAGYTQELVQHIGERDREEACQEAYDGPTQILEPLPLPRILGHLHEQEAFEDFVCWVYRQRIRKDQIDAEEQPRHLDKDILLIQILNDE